MLTTVADIHEHITRQRQKFAKAMKLKFLVTRIDGRASQGCPDFAPNALRFVARSKPISAHTAWTSSKKIGEKLTSTAAVRKEKYIRPSNSKVFMRKNPKEKRREFNPPRRRSETRSDSSVGQVRRPGMSKSRSRQTRESEAMKTSTIAWKVVRKFARAPPASPSHSSEQ